jgi:hypothetical protein
MRKAVKKLLKKKYKISFIRRAMQNARNDNDRRGSWKGWSSQFQSLAKLATTDRDGNLYVDSFYLLSPLKENQESDRHQSNPVGRVSQHLLKSCQVTANLEELSEMIDISGETLLMDAVNRLAKYKQGLDVRSMTMGIHWQNFCKNFSIFANNNEFKKRINFEVEEYKKDNPEHERRTTRPMVRPKRGETEQKPIILPDR